MRVSFLCFMFVLDYAQPLYFIDVTASAERERVGGGERASRSVPVRSCSVRSVPVRSSSSSSLQRSEKIERLWTVCSNGFRSFNKLLVVSGFRSFLVLVTRQLHRLMETSLTSFTFLKVSHFTSSRENNDMSWWLRAWSNLASLP